jgi:hypothetical protein
MDRREQVDLRGERADLLGRAAVDAHALGHDPRAHDLLGQRPDRGLDLVGALGELADELLGDRLGHRVGRRGALGLATDRARLGERGGPDRLDTGVDVVAVVGPRVELDVHDRAALGDERVDQVALEVDRVADPGLRGLQALGEDLFGHLRRTVGELLEAALGAAGLHHHDRDVGVTVLGERASRDDELEGRLVALLVRRVRQPAALGREGDPHRADRA